MYYSILNVKGCLPPLRYIFSCMLSNLPCYNQNGRNMQQMTNDTYRSRSCVRSENTYRHTGWRYQKSIPHFRSQVQVFFFFLIALTLQPATVYFHVHSNVNFTESLNYAMYSHFNQFLVYKCVIHVASTKCHYMYSAVWMFLFKGANPA
jgi:hypothetical protein